MKSSSSPAPMRRLAASILTASLSLSLAAPAFAATTINLQCMQNAVDRRESSLITSFDNYYSSVRSAMSIRKDGLRNSWSISDKKIRNDGIRAIEKTFRTAEKNARNARKDADRAAEKTYKSDAKLCETRS